MNEIIQTIEQAAALPEGTIVVKDGRAYTKDTTITSLAYPHDAVDTPRTAAYQWVCVRNLFHDVGVADSVDSSNVVGGTVVYKPAKVYKVGDVIPMSEARENLEVGSVIDLNIDRGNGIAWKRFASGWFPAWSGGDEMDISQVHGSVEMVILRLPETDETD